ncbi:MAG: hypothetical protein AAGL68_05555 [Pseudomonadota bacterium]
MLIRTIEKFLRDHDMPATKFGRLAAHDPRFVLDLRMGRIPRAATEARTRQWMADYVSAQNIAELNGARATAEFKALPGSFSPPRLQHKAPANITFGSALAQEIAHAV